MCESLSGVNTFVLFAVAILSAHERAEQKSLIWRQSTEPNGFEVTVVLGAKPWTGSTHSTWYEDDVGERERRWTIWFFIAC
ncbi:hypothetical protein EYF80_025835 [Liparis tanakae]|uniref:Secreted protein n=1 Tax=Liparis tanakae TaxID=230148 RepID=A0A4Z2HGA3_9TELE|nr:hypothetical protein EYF80_025835 [Liparis tanakae]